MPLELSIPIRGIFVIFLATLSFTLATESQAAEAHEFKCYVYSYVGEPGKDWELLPLDNGGYAPQEGEENKGQVVLKGRNEAGRQDAHLNLPGGMVFMAFEEPGGKRFITRFKNPKDHKLVASGWDRNTPQAYLVVTHVADYNGESKSLKHEATCQAVGKDQPVQPKPVEAFKCDINLTYHTLDLATGVPKANSPRDFNKTIERHYTPAEKPLWIASPQKNPRGLPLFETIAESRGPLGNRLTARFYYGEQSVAGLADFSSINQPLFIMVGSRPLPDGSQDMLTVSCETAEGKKEIGKIANETHPFDLNSALTAN